MKLQQSLLPWLVASLPLTTLASPLDSRRSLPTNQGSKHLRPVLERRQSSEIAGFAQGQPNDGRGKGSVFSGAWASSIAGGTNKELDLQNPDNLGQQSTDNGVVVNLKWSFSDSKTRLTNGGWAREQVITDLPASHDIAAAQQHLTKGSIRELHWHRVAEWGYVYAGQVAVAAVDEEGRNQVEILNVGDIWYFPKGEAHVIQGLADQYAGVNASVFASVPSPNPYILNATLSDLTISSPNGKLEGNSSYVYKASQQPATVVPGGGGTIKIVDSRNFPVAKTIAAAIVTLKPGALRELHWHPNAEEWLYFASGTAKATVFIGSANARTFDFSAGDTAVFPDNSGHYVENTSETEDLVWIEIYKSDRVVDISLTQWLALTPPGIVASTLKIPLDVAKSLKKEKQVILA